MAGYSIHELAAAAGVTPRTIHYYLQQRLLPPPKPRGPRTRYGEEYLVRLLAIARVQREDRIDLMAVRRKLAKATLDDLRRLAGVVATPTAATSGAPAATPPAPAALPEAAAPEAQLDAAAPAPAEARAAAAPVDDGDDDASPTPETATPHAPDPPARVGPYRAWHASPRERWERVEICPGVELHVRADADPEALRVAREMEAIYGRAPERDRG